jgi:hypothetical protein
MSRTGLEVADVFRHFGQAFRDQHGASLSRARWRAMAAIENCRTAALGGHVERCGDCGLRIPVILIIHSGRSRSLIPVIAIMLLA